LGIDGVEQVGSEYEDNRVILLSSREAVRKRPGMFLGTTSARGLEQLIYELVANGIDQYYRGEVTYVSVELKGEGFEICDDGPGLPFDEGSVVPERSLAEYFLKTIHHSATADDHAPHVHLALLGVGLAVVNFLSGRFEVNSWRAGKLWRQIYEEGVALTAPEVIEEGDGRGTKIWCVPDPKIFSAQPRYEEVRSILFEAAHVFSGVKLMLNEEVFIAPGGLKSLGPILRGSMRGTGSRSTYPPCHLEGCVDGVQYELAVWWGDDSPRTMTTHSWVNGVRTLHHGSHVDGVKAALKAIGTRPYLCLVHVLFHKPAFAGPTKDTLCVPFVRTLLEQELTPLVNYSRLKERASSRVSDLLF